MKRETGCSKVTISPGGLKPAEAGSRQGIYPVLLRKHDTVVLIFQPTGEREPTSMVSSYAKALKGQIISRVSGTSLWSQLLGILQRIPVQDLPGQQ